MSTQSAESASMKKNLEKKNWKTLYDCLLLPAIAILPNGGDQ
jgi:hypothetical protein